MVTYVKISELPPATEATGDSELEVNQAGVTRKITVDQIADVIAEILPPPDMSDYATDEEVADAIAAIPDPAWTEITGKPATFPPTVPIAWTDISGEPSTYPPSAHSHLAADLPAPPTTLPPNGPAGGDLSGTYPNPLIKPSVTNGQVLTTVAGIAAWAAAAGGGASISIGVTPPASPTAGALWWNSDAATGGGQLMIFYVDPGGAPGQWVPASPGMSTPTTPGGDFCVAQTSAFPTLTNIFATMILTQVVSGNANGVYSTSTGRYTPPAGRYAIDATYTAHCTASPSTFSLKVRKNGIDILTSMEVSAATGQQANPVVSVVLDANGTDYFDIQASSAFATSNVFSSFSFTAFPISGVKGPPGDPGVGLLQTVSYQTGAVATTTALIPPDDTIPQIGEGAEFMTLAIMPRSATSKLIISVTAHLASTITPGNALTAALFRDSTANALAALCLTSGPASTMQLFTFMHTVTSGTTSATTFRFRAGSASASTMTFNGQLGARVMGGVMASSIVIQEVL